MIQWMHSRVAKWILRFLAVFLIISFAAWGIEDMIRPSSNIDEVAEVDDNVITRNQFSLQFSRVMNSLRDQFGPDFDTRHAVQLGLMDQTLDQMINEQLISIDAHHLGLNAGEEQIRQTIFNDDRFRGVGNKFDRNRYQQYLAQEGVPETAFVSSIRKRIIRTQVAGALGAGITVPNKLHNILFKYSNQKRVVEMLITPFQKLTDIPTPENTILEKFHKNNSDQFKAPEYRKVVAIFLDPSIAAKRLRPTEQQIKEEFENQRANISIPERRAVEQALILDQKSAQELTKKIKAGNPFAKAVKKITGNQPVSLGLLSKFEMPDKDIASATFALNANEISRPIKSPLGWHILRVTKIVPGVEPKLKDNRAKIIGQLAREMAVEDLIKLTGKLDDTLAGGSQIEEAANIIGTKLIRIGAIDINGKGPNGKPVASLPKAPEFLKMVFKIPTGETTNVEETRGSAFFVLRVDKIVPPTLRPFKEVRNDVLQSWKRRSSQTNAKKKALKLKTVTKSRYSLNRIAKSEGGTVVTSKPFTRFNRNPKSVISDELSALVFKAKKGDLVVGRTSTGYALALVKDVISADPMQNKNDALHLKQQLKSTLTTDTMAQYLASLRQKYQVKINRNALNYIAGKNSGD